MLTSTSRRPGQAVTPPKVSMDTDEDVLIFGESASMNDDIRRGLDEERHRLEEMTQMLSKQMAEETKEHHHILQQMTNQDVQHVGTGAKQVWEEMQMHQTMAQTLSESMGLELVVPDMDTEEGLQDQIHQAAATLRDQLTHLRRLKDALREKGDDSLELEEWQEKTRDKERSLADHQERLAKTQASMQKKTQVRTDLRQEWEQEVRLARNGNSNHIGHSQNIVTFVITDNQGPTGSSRRKSQGIATTTRLAENTRHGYQNPRTQRYSSQPSVADCAVGTRPRPNCHSQRGGHPGSIGASGCQTASPGRARPQNQVGNGIGHGQ